MPDPHLEILGVYRPAISEAVYQEQWQITGSNQQTEEHFSGLILIEAVLHNADGSFNIAKIGQQPSYSSDTDHFQVPYDEALLSGDGEILVQRKMNCVHGTGSLRFAFYLHLYDPLQSLTTQYGSARCPAIQPIPERLKRLVPYHVI